MIDILNKLYLRCQYDQSFQFKYKSDRGLIWLGLEMRSGLGFGDMRSRFDLVGVENAIEVCFGDL